MGLDPDGTRPRFFHERVQIADVPTHLEQIPGKRYARSVDLATPQAYVALLGLQLSGMLIAFLADRWQQIQAGK
jgi:hypothetical protein